VDFETDPGKNTFHFQTFSATKSIVTPVTPESCSLGGKRASELNWRSCQGQMSLKPSGKGAARQPEFSIFDPGLRLKLRGD
jgi:hypothetical protein